MLGDSATTFSDTFTTVTFMRRAILLSGRVLRGIRLCVGPSSWRGRWKAGTNLLRENGKDRNAAGARPSSSTRQGRTRVWIARLQGIVERTYESHRFTVGMPGKPPAAAHVTPAAPDEPPADPTAAGSP